VASIILFKYFVHFCISVSPESMFYALLFNLYTCMLFIVCHFTSGRGVKYCSECCCMSVHMSLSVRICLVKFLRWWHQLAAVKGGSALMCHYLAKSECLVLSKSFSVVTYLQVCILCSSVREYAI